MEAGVAARPPYSPHRERNQSWRTIQNDLSGKDLLNCNAISIARRGDWSVNRKGFTMYWTKNLRVGSARRFVRLQMG
jgi:hypothetical protein